MVSFSFQFLDLDIQTRFVWVNFHHPDFYPQSIPFHHQGGKSLEVELIRKASQLITDELIQDISFIVPELFKPLDNKESHYLLFQVDEDGQNLGKEMEQHLLSQVNQNILSSVEYYFRNNRNFFLVFSGVQDPNNRASNNNYPYTLTLLCNLMIVNDYLLVNFLLKDRKTGIVISMVNTKYKLGSNVIERINLIDISVEDNFIFKLHQCERSGLGFNIQLSVRNLQGFQRKVLIKNDSYCILDDGLKYFPQSLEKESDPNSSLEDAEEICLDLIRNHNIFIPGGYNTRKCLKFNNSVFESNNYIKSMHLLNSEATKFSFQEIPIRD